MSLSSVSIGTLKPLDYPTFLCGLIVVLWGHQEASDGIAPLKYTWTPTLPHTFLTLSLSPLV